VLGAICKRWCVEAAGLGVGIVSHYRARNSTRFNSGYVHVLDVAAPHTWGSGAY